VSGTGPAPTRRPDPARPGTVYRARPRFTLRRAAAGSGARPAPGPGTASRLRGVLARRRRLWLVAVPILLVLLVVYPLALFGVAWGHLGRVDALVAGGPADTPGRTYLVVGSDSREALTPEQRKRLGTGSAAGRRTDTIMLLHVPSGGGPTVLVSLPRDSYVSIAGHGKNKINAAYAFGGPQLLVRTVEQATGLAVDAYVETGLAGYAALVDAVGGVDVCVKRALNDAKAHLNVKAGCQTLDGPTALGYARARYSDPLGDLGRVQRQRQVLAAIAGKVLSPSVILLPWQAFATAGAGGDALVVDSGTSPVGLVQFVLAMRSVAGGGGVSLTVPVARTNLATSVGEAVEWNAAGAKSLFDALRADNTEAVRPIAAAQQKATA